jgi:hypothetical protein
VSVAGRVSYFSTELEEVPCFVITGKIISNLLVELPLVRNKIKFYLIIQGTYSVIAVDEGMLKYLIPFQK